MYTDLIDQGYACLRRSDPEAALRWFQQAIDATPERPQAYFAMAMAHAERGSSEGVMRGLREALRVEPRYAPARACLGIELLKQYDIRGAEDAFELALQDDPTNLFVHCKYAEYFFRLGFYPRAVALLEQGLRAPHGANEQVVAQARHLLVQAKQKSKGLIVREPPDPRQLLHLFTRLRWWLGRQKRRAEMGKVS